jgi:small subunit ribosomal protein S16
MLKIKLSPTGKIHHRYYRVVVAEGKSKLTGKYIALLGNYDPHNADNKLTLNKKLYQEWIAKGAQPTKTIINLVNKNK